MTTRGERCHAVAWALLAGLMPLSAACGDSSNQTEQVANSVCLPRASLTHGTMVGAVTAHAAKVWFRVAPGAEVRIDCGHERDLDDAAPCSDGSFITKREADYTGMLHLVGLRPDTEYYYRVVIDGRPVSQREYARFKTFPERSATQVTIGLLADSICQGKAPQLVKLAADHPDFVVILGDFPHADAVTLQTMRAMRRCVRDADGALGADFRRHVAGRFPIAYVWDDHDYCDADSGASCEARETALRVHDEYWPAYDRPLPDNGIWHSFGYGDLVEVFMLDLRFNRKAEHLGDDEAEWTKLGPQQKRWFVDALGRSTAKWKVVISTVTFNGTTVKYLDETWSGTPEEREELIAEINRIDPGHVVFVSGDIHTGGALDDGTNAGLPEMSIPDTNVVIPTCTPCDEQTRICPNPERACGFWSHMFDASGVGYGVITATPDELNLMIKDRKGGEKATLSLRHLKAGAARP